jgi:cold-inducible RNA-binding protein
MSKKLFIGGISWNVTDEQLREVFEEIGEVVYCKIIMDRETGRSRGFGFVEYATDAEANEAIDKFEGYELDGRALHVSAARERDR